MTLHMNSKLHCWPTGVPERCAPAYLIQVGRARHCGRVGLRVVHFAVAADEGKGLHHLDHLNRHIQTDGDEVA
jgi:hypothetical protein